MKKRFTVFVVALMLVTCTYSVTYATDFNSLDLENVVSVLDLKDKPIEFKAPDEISNLGKILYTKAVNVGGEKALLYPVFSDPAQALKNVYNDTKNILASIQEIYKLEDFNAETWGIYYSKVSSYEEYISRNYLGKDKDTILNQYIPELNSFFDIYENGSRNSDIIRLIEDSANQSSNLSKVSVGDDAVKDIEIALPDSSLSTVAAEPTLLATTSSYSTSDAVDYAIDWATDRNPIYANYGDNDCTNFASQIKQAGGATINYTGNANTGWWIILDFLKQSSRSWRVAADFGNYFGTKSSTTSFYTFSDRVVKGSYIGVDYDNDGDFNHIGFVTATSTSTYTTNGVTYYNFKIAQHSTDYNAWVNSGTNGWDRIHLNYSNPRYGVIN